MKRDVGFTLIELVLVMLIVGLFSIVVIPKYYNTFLTNVEQVTNFEISEIVKAIMGDTSVGYEGFYQHMGRYPANAEGLAVLYDSTLLTSGSPTFDPMSGRGWGGPYIDNSDNDSNGTPDILEDPWGNAYHYDEGTRRIWSNGPDKVNNNGSGDDILVIFGN